MEPDIVYDLLVVGGGIAGLSAAASAMQSGGTVVLLDRAPREDRGGNTRWTESLLRMKDEDAASDDFEERLAGNVGQYLDPSLMREVATSSSHDWSSIVKALGFTDPEVIATLSDQAPAVVSWLGEFGVRFDALPTYFITSSQPRISPVGGGLAMIEVLGNWLEANGAAVQFETSARSLLQDKDGSVCGARVVDRSGTVRSLYARHTVLASGGFEGNPEMLAHYVGLRARFIRPVARGGYYNKGEGIRMALDIGAAPSGDFTQFHAEPLDPRSGMPEPIVLVFNYGILVNQEGRRFVDEASATVDSTYEQVARLIQGETDGTAYVVLDSKIDDVPNWHRGVRTDQPPITGDTLGALATKLGIDTETFLNTIEDYNAACPSEAGFKPLDLDGLCTRPEYKPAKSNWSRRIEKEPFFAYPIICGNCLTFGGLKVNARAQVLDTDGVPIPGLYAAGEITGFYYGSYPGGTSVLRGAVFGRIAGQDAMRQLRSNESGRPPSASDDR